jgi:hypothetical protein
MSDFMQLETTQKGALYSCQCAKCGADLFTHEWAYYDHNERRDAMQAGTLRCDQCVVGRADPETFSSDGRQYACRYSAPGYLDCTEWTYGKNLRALEREVRDMFGEDA